MFAHKDYLETRRSTPFPLMGEPAPSDNDLAEMLKIAARTPDHGKLFPWRFIIISKVKGTELGEKIVDIFKEIEPEAEEKRLTIERGRLSRAPVCVALISKAAPHVKIPEWEQVLSVGAVGMNLLHAAHALGYGAVWVTEWLSYNDKIKTLINLEPHEKIAGFFHIGRPTGKADDRPRPEMATIVSTL